MIFVQLFLRRLISLLPIMLIVSFGVFALILAVPGDPARTLAGPEASPQRAAEIREQYGLDDPIFQQYGRWLSKAVRFDFGNSIANGENVRESIVDRLQNTAEIALSGLAVALVAGTALGIVAGTRPSSWIDRLVTVVATLGVAVPSFVVAILLVQVLSIQLHLLPAVGYTSITTNFGDWLEHVAMPAIALGAVGAAALGRQLRSGLITTLQSDYVRTSWAVGSSAPVVIVRHAVRNAAIPAVSVIGLQLAALLGGTVIIETVFSIQGIGSLLFGAVVNKDLPVIQGIAVFFVLVQMTLNLVVDMVLVTLNPRLRVR